MPFPSIAETIAEGTTISAYCAFPCTHSADLDLQAMAERFGAGAELSAFTVNRWLRCTVCGQRSGTIRRHDIYRPNVMYDTYGRLPETKKPAAE